MLSSMRGRDNLGMRTNCIVQVGGTIFSGPAPSSTFYRQTMPSLGSYLTRIANAVAKGWQTKAWDGVTDGRERATVLASSSDKIAPRRIMPG